MSRVSLSDVKKFNNESNLLFGRREIYQAFGGHQVNDRAGHSAAGYYSMRQSKLERQFAEAAKDEAEGQLEAAAAEDGKTNGKGAMSGVVAYINGYAGPDASDLEMRQLVVSHGGAIRQFFSISRVTHIIASSMSKSKIQQLLTTKSSSRRIAPVVHVVRPEWALDSIAAGKRLSVHKYLLFRDATNCKLPVLARSVAASEASEIESTGSAVPLPVGHSSMQEEQEHTDPPPRPPRRISFFATMRKHQKAVPLTQL